MSPISKFSNERFAAAYLESVKISFYNSNSAIINEISIVQVFLDQRWAYPEGGKQGMDFSCTA